MWHWKGIFKNYNLFFESSSILCESYEFGKLQDSQLDKIKNIQDSFLRILNSYVTLMQPQPSIIKYIKRKKVVHNSHVWDVMCLVD